MWKTYVVKLFIVCIVALHFILANKALRLLRSKDSNSTEKSSKKQKDATCGVYIAKSTIPLAGMGVYSGENAREGTRIGPSDIMIPIGYDHDHYYSGKEYGVIVNDYVWGDKGDEDEISRLLPLEGEATTYMVPGFGALPNHFAVPNIVYEDRALDSKHTGPRVDYGAFTPFHNYHIVSERNMQAGSEMFLDYGSSYFTSRESIYGKIPQRRHYQAAGELINKFLTLVANDKQQTEPNLLSQHLWSLLWEYASSDARKNMPDSIIQQEQKNQDTALVDKFVQNVEKLPDSKQALWNMYREVADGYVRVALPKTIQEIEAVGASGGIRKYMENMHTRSKSWLSKNGLCVDYLRIKASTVLEAGRGAFSRVFLPKGSLITPAPVIQMRQSTLESPVVLKTNKRIADQFNYSKLLLNYCFGHPTSSVRLCPYGSTSHLINHASSDKANAEIRWSTSSLMNSTRLIASAQELLEQEYPARILFDIVATRDIFPDEEIFINYGEAWESAWNKHQSEWDARYGSPTNDSPLVGDGSTMTACYYNFEASRLPFQEKQSLRRRIESEEYEWVYENEEPHTLGGLYQCDVRFEEKSGKDWLAATIYPLESMKGIQPRMVRFVPRKAIVAVNKEWLMEANEGTEAIRKRSLLPFRHYIVMPDDMVPQSWRDLTP